MRPPQWGTSETGKLWSECAYFDLYLLLRGSMPASVGLVKGREGGGDRLKGRMSLTPLLTGDGKSTSSHTDPTDITTKIPRSLQQLSSEQLHQQLVSLGERPGSIIDLTRPAYLAYLVKLEAGTQPAGNSRYKGVLLGYSLLLRAIFICSAPFNSLSLPHLFSPSLPPSFPPLLTPALPLSFSPSSLPPSLIPWFHIIPPSLSLPHRLQV